MISSFSDIFWFLKAHFLTYIFHPNPMHKQRLPADLPQNSSAHLLYSATCVFFPNISREMVTSSDTQPWLAVEKKTKKKNLSLTHVGLIKLVDFLPLPSRCIWLKVKKDSCQETRRKHLNTDWKNKKIKNSSCEKRKWNQKNFEIF